MSDRVAYLVGNTKGRDHLYWPLITPARAASEGLPARQLGVNIVTMMALAWRVKKWRVSGLAVAGTMHQVRTHSPGVTTTYDWSTSFEIPDFDVVMLNGATREAGLLSTFFNAFGFRGLMHDGWNGTGGGMVAETTAFSFNSVPPEFFDPASGSESGTFSSQSGAGATIQVANGPSTGGNNIVYYDPGTQLFYPEFSFGVSIIPHYAFALLGFASQFNISADMRDISGSDGTVTVDPACSVLMAPDTWVSAPSFQLPLKAGGFIYAGAGAGPTTRSGSVDATMTAVEYWPYENSQGLPIYDTASGVPLRDPFS